MATVIGRTRSLIKRFEMTSPESLEIFRPPIDRSMRILDRSFFKKVVPLSAATILNVQNLHTARTKLNASGDVLSAYRILPIRPDDLQPGKKCIILRPGVQAEDKSTWSPTIAELVEEKVAQIRPFDLELSYDNWPAHDLLEAVLPNDPELPEHERETPAGFATVGHIAHVNLRTHHIPYKQIIGEIIVDKNPNIRTVINKTEDVGTESVFRTFPYEVLAGPEEMDVTVSESGCTFKFNYGKVYWNSRLETEHKRIISKFAEGETVCDVMAGVGPFAVPAGKKKVFVWANDLNPDSYAGLQTATTLNKVQHFVRPSCEDGRAFIRRATTELRHHPRTVSYQKRRLIRLPPTAAAQDNWAQKQDKQANTVTMEEPSTFSHYVMNLPATAVEFLDAFHGVYAGRQREFLPHTTRSLPMVHVYLFTARRDTEQEEQDDVCERVSKHLGHSLRDSMDLELFDVRLVSPKKKMYCASFRLPPEVAFAEVESPL